MDRTTRILSAVVIGLVTFAVIMLGALAAKAHHGGDGENGPTVLVGTSGPDKLVGGHGPDTIRALGGNDRVWLGRGPDTVSCGGGWDIVNTRAPGAEQGDTIATDCEVLRVGEGPGPG